MKADAEMKNLLDSLEAQMKNTETQTARLDTRVTGVEDTVGNLQLRAKTLEHEIDPSKPKEHDSEAMLPDLRSELAAKFTELLDLWSSNLPKAMPRFQSSDLLPEMGTLAHLTNKEHSRLHEPLRWMAEWRDARSASVAFLNNVELKAVCLTPYCTVACVRGIDTLCKARSNLQHPKECPPLYLGFWFCEQLEIGNSGLCDAVVISGLDCE